jgi:subfamily B ATP-binding cassette protein HlyB/CyaB
MTSQSLKRITLPLITEIFGYQIAESDFQQCLQMVQYLTPKVGKFWLGTEAKAGLYLILEGKVRLLDVNEELITTLEPGDTFGEFTLFSEANLTSYDGRAALGLQLAFLPQTFIVNLWQKYPQIRETLWQQAQNCYALISDSNDFLTDTAIASESVPWTSPIREEQSQKKINKAYFPSPADQIGHWLQKITCRYPFFAQQSASDCGAACLVTISRYWGKKFSINRVRDIANVDANGTSLRGLSAAAESVGFSTRPVKASLDQLAKQTLPAIAHWEGKHYIVVYEITKKTVIVADPAIGQLTLTHREFLAKWTGYTLLLQPTFLFKEAKETTTPFWQFFELVKPYRLVLAEVFVASLLIQIFGLITPIFTQIILDRVVVQRSDLTLFTIGLGLLIFGIFRVMIIGLRQYLLDHTANKMDLALIVGFIRHTLRLPLGFFESRYVGDIISRVQENSKIERFLSGESLSILLDLLTVFIYVGLMFWYSWKMALVVLIIVPPFFLLALISTPFLRRISREIFNTNTSEGSYLIEVLSGIRTVKSTAVEQTVRWHWEELLQQAVKKKFSGEIIGKE